MPSFGLRSINKLAECDDRLQKVFNEVIKHFDCSVLVGRRDEPTQEEMFHTGKSKLHWPDSKHNLNPSKAADVAPYPINWKDRERFTYFAGFVLGIAASMGIKLRWGGDWDADTEVFDNGFDDLPHFEVVD